MAELTVGTPVRPAPPRGLIDDYTRAIRAKTLVLLGLAAALVATAGFGLALGPMGIPLSEVVQALVARPLGASWVSAQTENVVWNIRLPRLATAMVAGMGLALGGVILQSLLRNPMASPFTLGIASGASLGAALAIIFGFSAFGVYGIVGNAFLFAMAVSLLILLIGQWKGATPMSLILAGIALMYFFGATTTLLIYFADADATREVMFWSVGSLSRADWESFVFISAALVATLPVFLWKSGDLNRLLLGDETATSLGIAVGPLRIGLMFLVALLVAVTVAFTGGIGFLGLVAPHLARLLIGSDHRFLIPATALIGALLLTLADLVSLHAFESVVLPVGVVTAFIGSPLFIYLILRRRETGGGA
ncbi:MAG: iron ABC transporter permease [Halorhodospira halophila]|uniref:FecCD family ABC transporter permease n=1 Tax=Halorhodospira TaxID=85108 RepID=UPI001914B475|nr:MULTISPECIES: iron ABC transporter permease [Halorhodospira]MBK5936013.1 iron ABC transporter permease [Halorhodospira halophila]MBK5943675.1 iron ABC transporter permease [Halorhodospira halophila]MCC3750003.1 iron ABC transporter permease [Halorhodospira halophila]MCG5529150.1 iron ABC transporter permease [Halorhodospira halophila]MCG5532097.1 iron ABC transporter permease [Halorhodospira sp. 9621]